MKFWKDFFEGITWEWIWWVTLAVTGGWILFFFVVMCFQL